MSMPSGAAGEDAGDFGDDIAAAFDCDGIADAHAEPADFIWIVQRGSLDGGAADEDGLQDGDGRDFAGAAYSELDCKQLRGGGTGGELVGDGPAGGPCR